jgi:hypothetical protein
MEDGGRSYLANDLLGSWDQQGTSKGRPVRTYYGCTWLTTYYVRASTGLGLVFFVWMFERSGTHEGSVTVVDRSVGRLPYLHSMSSAAP